MPPETSIPKATAAPKKFGLFASFFFALFPAVALAFATASFVEASVSLLPAETQAATIIDRYTRMVGGHQYDRGQTRHGLVLEFADGTQVRVKCSPSLYEGWPNGMIVQAEVFPRLDHKVTAMAWQPDETQRAEGHQPVTYTVVGSWWGHLLLGAGLLAVTLYLCKEFFNPKRILFRPFLYFLLILSIPMGFGIAIGWTSG